MTALDSHHTSLVASLADEPQCPKRDSVEAAGPAARVAMKSTVSEVRCDRT